MGHLVGNLVRCGPGSIPGARPFFEVYGRTYKGKLFRNVRPEPPGYRISGGMVIAVHTSLVNYEKLHPEAFPGRLKEWETAFERIMTDIKAG